MARNRVEVGPVETPIETFSGEDNTLRSVSIVTGMDVVGTNLTVDKMTPVVEYPYTEDSVELIAPSDYKAVRTSDDFLLATNRKFVNLRSLLYGTEVRYYKDDILDQKMYLKNVDRITKSGFKLNSMSAIGLLDRQKHRGGIYSGQTFREVLAEIIGGFINYTVADEVANIQVYGWLPYTSKRKNLHQLLFACGVVCGKDENGDPVFRFIASANPVVIPDSRFYSGGNVDYNDPASAVDVTEHSFFALDTDEVTTVYDNTDGSETADHTFLDFGKVAPLHDLETTGTLVINESGVNWAIVTGTGKLTGKKYTHSTRIMRRYADDVTGQEENVASVSDCTLVTVANSINVATRVLSYYNSKKTVAASIVLNGEKAGDFIKATDPYEDPIEGFISSMETTVSAKNKANCKIITGYAPGGVGNNYTRSKILTGSGTIDLVDFVRDKEDKHIQITLLSGGHGGGRGQDGENGGRASSSSLGSAGEGGEPGTPGDGGDVVTITLDLTGYDSYVVDFSCGEGGESDEHGEATTLGEFTSAAGAPSSNGITDIFTGKVYGQRGKAGMAGAKGSGSDGVGPDLTYEGVTYHPGAAGRDVSGYVTGYAYGGRGGGAAAGANGENGEDGRTESNNGNGFNDGGVGGRGATPPQRKTAPGYGQGGDAGHGGGGGGGGGAATGPENYSWPGNGGPGGKGGLGGKGSKGLIMIFY